MDIRIFAEEYRLKMRRDDCGENIVPGKAGQIYDHGSGLMGVMVMPGRPFVWAYVRKRLIAAGFRVIQNGDWEGAALFDPHDPSQARLAIRTIGARRKRQLSEAQRAILAERMGRVRAFAGH